MKILSASAISSIFISNISDYRQEFCYKFMASLLNDPAISFELKSQLNRALMYCLEGCDEGMFIHILEYI